MTTPAQVELSAPRRTTAYATPRQRPQPLPASTPRFRCGASCSCGLGHGPHGTIPVSTAVSPVVAPAGPLTAPLVVVVGARRSSPRSASLLHQRHAHRSSPGRSIRSQDREGSRQGCDDAVPTFCRRRASRNALPARVLPLSGDPSDSTVLVAPHRPGISLACRAPAPCLQVPGGARRGWPGTRRGRPARTQDEPTEPRRRRCRARHRAATRRRRRSIDVQTRQREHAR